jgi:ubiquinone/menaquinone biosynthesis C-methylase UbiE
MTDQAVEREVKSKYGSIARQVIQTGASGGCGCGCSGAGEAGEIAVTPAGDLVTRDLYSAAETATLPEGAVLASLGCGNPTALADLRPGETVLDLGSGGGLDVLLAARRVGPTGRAIGVDFTAEMLGLARVNQRKAGLDNVEFLKGSIDALPLPDQSVDVIISNCVINLTADKRRVLREAFRVLRPGGRLAVSDIVARRPVAPEVRRSVELWVGCVAGALEAAEYLRLLAEAGFEAAELEPTRVYEIDDVKAFAESAGVEEMVARAASGCFMGAFVRATRPRA